MTKKDTLLEFPCQFPIKIIGVNKDSYIVEVIELAQKHFPQTTKDDLRSGLSGKGRYLSITLTLTVYDKTTLDALYLELTQHPDTRMVL